MSRDPGPETEAERLERDAAIWHWLPPLNAQGSSLDFNVADTGAVGAINIERLNLVKRIIDESRQFVEQVYIPDLMAIAPFYLDWAGIGGGLRNYMSYGDLPTRGYGRPEFFKFPRGAILDRNLSEVHEVNGRDAEEIKDRISQMTPLWYHPPPVRR